MDRMLKTTDVLDALGCSRATLHRLRTNNQFPQPFKLGRVNRWPESVISEWIEQNKNGKIKIQ